MRCVRCAWTWDIHHGRSLQLSDLLFRFLYCVDAKLEHFDELRLLRNEQTLTAVLSLCFSTLASEPNILTVKESQ
jgi:hypothetical protein